MFTRLIDWLRYNMTLDLDHAAHKWLHRGTPHDHPFGPAIPSGVDYRGVPTAECVCGGRAFYMVVFFSDDYTLAGYDTCGMCTDCGALLTVCTPLDHPEYEGSE